MPYIGAGVQRFNTADNLTVTGTSELKNDVTVTGDVTASGTVLPTGDTAAGDAAALGFTSAEGLILTGQGSTSDITVKNDADTTVFTVPTGTDDISFPDNAAILMGAGNDLKIFHNGSNSQINDLSTGNLQLLSNGAGVDVLKTDGEVMAKFITDGAVELYHDNSKKLETASTGIDITGAFTATSGSTITTADNTTQLTLKSTDADGSLGPKLDLTRDSSSPADGDNCGQINFNIDNDAGESTQYGDIFVGATDVTDGSESGHMTFSTMKGGSRHSRMKLHSDETVFNEDSVGTIDFRVESDSRTHMLFVDSSADAVGIGTSSPNVTLHVFGSSAEVAIDDTAGAPLIRFRDNGNTRALLKIDTSNNMQFHTGADGNTAEVGRFDSSGNFLVGKTSSGSFTESSVELNNTGYIMSARNDGANIFLSRQGSSAPEGAMIALSKDNTEIGRIGVKSLRMYMGSSSTGLAFEGSQADSIYPVSASGDGSLRDNAIDLGFASSRFDDIFATNSTINTSDENEKQDIASLTSAEITAAKEISKLFKTFKWKDKVVAKGDAARTHTGVIAQQVQKAMSDAGLDATKYAFWCSNTWTNDDGDEQTRMGVRYPELLAFVGAATEQRLADIETRLAALES